MIVRALAVLLSAGAFAALWLGYFQLGVLRGTAFWDYRYLIFAVTAFLGLSVLEWAVGWLKKKVNGTPDDH